MVGNNFFFFFYIYILHLDIPLIIFFFLYYFTFLCISKNTLKVCVHVIHRNLRFDFLLFYWEWLDVHLNGLFKYKLYMKWMESAFTKQCWQESWKKNLDCFSPENKLSLHENSFQYLVTRSFKRWCISNIHVAVKIWYLLKLRW